MAVIRWGGSVGHDDVGGVGECWYVGMGVRLVQGVGGIGDCGMGIGVIVAGDIQPFM